MKQPPMALVPPEVINAYGSPGHLLRALSTTLNIMLQQKGPRDIMSEAQKAGCEVMDFIVEELDALVERINVKAEEFEAKHENKVISPTVSQILLPR